jgi:hypothetical protein
MRSVKTAERTKLSASARIAYGAVIAAISPPGHARAGNLRNRTRQIELRVAVDHVLAFDERWEVRLVADVEEDGEASDEELQREKVPDAQRARRPENRDQHEEDCARAI